jgi:hypothetical protein
MAVSASASKKKYTLSLPPALVDVAKQFSTANYGDFSGMVEYLLRDYLQKKGIDPDITPDGVSKAQKPKKA